MTDKQRSHLNKTLTLTPTEHERYRRRLRRLSGQTTLSAMTDVTLNQDMREAIQCVPAGCVDLAFIDPPYNLTKNFNGRAFKQTSTANYTSWIESWFPDLLRLLKPTASVYFCGDWQSAASIQFVLEKHCVLHNRITWEREKGRGAKRNWKNASEDIWFATLSNQFTFNIEAVKLKRRVIAPYVDTNGHPKDWESTSDGNFRLTYPSNLWTDLTVPFWSMAENTDHPTQKPEKLLAKIILASSNVGDLVFDPFLGSGTTSVVAKKLHRRYCGIEIDETYACLAEKRLALAEHDTSIQGYREGVFWERNSGSSKSKLPKSSSSQNGLFDLTTEQTEEIAN